MYVIIDTGAIRQLMNSTLTSREALAERSGVSFATISHLFNYKYKNVQDSSVKRICVALGVDPVDVVARPEAIRERYEDVSERIGRGSGTPAQLAKYKKELDELEHIMDKYGIWL